MKSTDPQLLGISPGGAAALVRLLRSAVICYCLLVFVAMLGGICDQPHPSYASGMSWIFYRFERSLQLAAPFTGAFVIAMGIGCAFNPPRSLRAGPARRACMTRLRSSVGCLRSRLVYEIGLLAVAGYLAQTQIEYWAQRQIPCGFIWPPERFFLAVVWLIGSVWLGAAIGGPRRAAWVTPAIFLCLCVLLGYPESNGWIRE